MKTCNKCNESKPITEFAFVKQKNNYHGTCKCCLAAYRKEFYHTQTKPLEKDKQYRAKYKKTPEQAFHNRSEASKAKGRIQHIKALANKARKVVANRSTYKTLPCREIFVMNKYWVLDYPNFRYHYSGFFDDFKDSDWDIEKWIV